MPRRIDLAGGHEIVLIVCGDAPGHAEVAEDWGCSVVEQKHVARVEVAVDDRTAGMLLQPNQPDQDAAGDVGSPAELEVGDRGEQAGQRSLSMVGEDQVEDAAPTVMTAVEEGDDMRVASSSQQQPGFSSQTCLALVGIGAAGELGDGLSVFVPGV